MNHEKTKKNYRIIDCGTYLSFLATGLRPRQRRLALEIIYLLFLFCISLKTM